MRTAVHSPLAGLAATPASTPTPPHLSILQVDVSLLHRNRPVSTTIVAYAIKCHACHKIYIGETGTRLGDRCREHLRSTRLPDSDRPVGCYFASSGHRTQETLVSVIRSGFRDATDRRSFEARMILRHRTLHHNGLNVDLGFMESQRAL